MPTPYAGYRVAFGRDWAYDKCKKFFARGFKADFSVPEDAFATVEIPFHKFTKCWDDATGDAIITCEEDSQFCPSLTRLLHLETVSVWAEGVAADVTLSVQSISAYGCDAARAQTSRSRTTYAMVGFLLLALAGALTCSCIVWRRRTLRTIRDGKTADTMSASLQPLPDNKANALGMGS